MCADFLPQVESCRIPCGPCFRIPLKVGVVLICITNFIAFLSTWLSIYDPLCLEHTSTAIDRNIFLRFAANAMGAVMTALAIASLLVLTLLCKEDDSPGIKGFYCYTTFAVAAFTIMFDVSEYLFMSAPGYSLNCYLFEKPIFLTTTENRWIVDDKNRDLMLKGVIAGCVVDFIYILILFYFACVVRSLNAED